MGRHVPFDANGLSLSTAGGNMRKVTWAALIAVTAMVVTMSGVAAADDPSGPQTFLITTVQTPPEPAVRTITAYGVVSDAGTEEILDMHTLPDRSRLVRPTRLCATDMLPSAVLWM